MPTPEWAAAFVNIPWQEHGRSWTGVDCWGLVRLIYRERHRIELPSYVETYKTTDDAAEISAMMRHEQPKTWDAVENKVEEGDVVLLRLSGVPMHVGVVLVPPPPTYIAKESSFELLRGEFIHAREGTGSVIERLESPLWRRRVLGFYRYRGDR